MPDTTLAHGDISQVVFVTKCGNRRAFNIRNYQLTDTYPGGDDLVHLVEELWQRVTTAWVRMLHPTANPEWIYARRIRPTIGDWATRTGTLVPTTRIPGELYPPQICFLTRLLATTATNVRKGRWYMSFCPGGAIDTNGEITPAFKGRADIFGADLVTAADTTTVGGNGLHLPGLYHRASLSFSPIDAWELQRFWATQRRRWDGNQPYGLPY